MKRDYRLFIRDIFEAIENIEYFIGNMDFDEFYADAKKNRGIVEKGKEATFWHLISEGKSEKDRLPDLRRCERIRWPRPIIEHHDRLTIKFWGPERKGGKRTCFW